MPLVSIIIPTRNRQKFAYESIKVMLSYNLDLEIIVQDNSDDDSLGNMLKYEIEANKIIYHYVERRIAGVDNYNYAVAYATGEYLCALGDDDVVLPNIIDCARWMKQNDIDAISPSRSLVYFWPDKEKNGMLKLIRFSSKCDKYDTQESVINVLKNGGQDYLKLHLACSYHGLIRLSKMKRIQHITGRYYGGLSPDIYSATCLSLLENMNFFELDYPITLPGVSPPSTSYDSAKGKHIGYLSEAPHFIGLIEPYEWNKEVPQIYSVQTIWCDTFLTAIKKMDREDLIKKYFNREKLVNRLLLENINNKEFIIDNLSDDDKELIKDIKIKSNILIAIKKKMRRGLSIITGKNKENYRCNTIGEAVIEVNQYLSNLSCYSTWIDLISGKIEI